MPAPADLLTLARLGAAAMMPIAMSRGGTFPVLLWLVAIGTDFADGRVARRLGGGTDRGALLDPVADVAFILAAFVPAAAWGHVSWLVPGAILASVVRYGVAMARARPRGLGREPARSRVGHAAGVVNYAGVGVLVAAMAWPKSLASPCLPVAALVIVVVNLGAVAERSVRRQLARGAT